MPPYCIALVVGWISSSLLLAAFRIPTASEATTAVVVGGILGTAFVAGIVYVIRQLTNAQIERERVRNKAFIEMQLERDKALKDTFTEQNRELKEQLDEMQVKLKEASDRASMESVAARGLRTDFQTSNSLNLELTRKLVDMTTQMSRMHDEMSQLRSELWTFAAGKAAKEGYVIGELPAARPINSAHPVPEKTT